MTSGKTDENEFSNSHSMKHHDDKIIDPIHYSILSRGDYTTPLTRRFNNQPRIYTTLNDLEYENTNETFIFSKPKTKDDLFQESQERVMQHLETIIQSQNDTLTSSFREIDEMSQENEEQLEKIEKYLKKIKLKMMKKKHFSSKKSIRSNQIDGELPKTKSNMKNDRGTNLMKINQDQLM